MPDPRLDTYSAIPWLLVSFNIPGGAAAADYDGAAFIAPFACEVIDVTEVHQTAGSDGGAVTLMLVKAGNGVAKASGTNVLNAGLDLKAAINTVQTATLHTTLANRQLAENDRLALVSAGVLTAVDGVFVQVLVRAR